VTFLNEFSTAQIGMSFLNNVDLMRKALQLVSRMSDERCEGIVDICEAIAKVISAAGMSHREVWASHLAQFIRRGVDSYQALQFSKKYECKQQICELVLEIGKESYELFHSCIDLWGYEFL